MTDIEKIVQGLSEAQRRAVLWLPQDGGWKDHRRVAKANDGISDYTLNVMKERIIGKPDRKIAQIFRLVEGSFNTGALEKRQVWRNTQYRLTPLGRAVRAHLEGKTHGSED